MPQAPDLTDAEIGELDDLLAAVPAPLQALDVVMLDGYLCGVLAQPEIVPPEAWMPPAFDWNLGDGDSGAVLSPDTPGWHAAKHERLTTLTLRRHAHLAAVMTDPGWFDPIVMTPADDQGRPLPAKAAIEAALGPWVIGFEHALNHFTGLEEVPALEVADLLACVRRHLPDQDEEEQAETAALDQEHPLKSLDAAIEDLVGNVIELADLARAERVKVVTVRREAPKVGRNDPCPCGSGRKFKQCHGRSEGGAAP